MTKGTNQRWRQAARLTIRAMSITFLTSTAVAADYLPTKEVQRKPAFIMGIHPGASPQELFKDYQPILAYLESKTGERFEFESSRDYEDYEQKLRSRRFHFSLPNPAQTILAASNGYRIVAKMRIDDYFRGVIIANAASPLKAPGDIGKSEMCFPSATALAATLMPLAYLQANGLKVSDVPKAYVGTHNSVIEHAANGTYAACGTGIRLLDAWRLANPQRANQVKVLWTTPSMPSNGIVARKDVDPLLTEKVVQALVELEHDPNVDQRVFTKQQQRFERASDQTYDPLRAFLLKYQKDIGLPANLAAMLSTQVSGQ